MILLLCIVTYWTSTIYALEGKYTEELNYALTGLNRSLVYLTTHPATTNFDQLQVAITLGQLKASLRRLNKSLTITEEQFQTIRQIVTNLEDDFKNKSDVYKSYLFGKDNWEFDYPSKNTDSSIKYQSQDMEIISEKNFNYCVEQLRGQNKFDGKPCFITDYCWKYMTAPNKSYGYVGTELLYLLLADNNNCDSKMETLAEKHGLTSFHYLYDVICATLLSTIKSEPIVWNSDANTYMLFCGMVGHRSLFASAYEKVKFWLSFQQDDGCIADTPSTQQSSLDWLFKLLNVNKQGTCVMERTASTVALLTLFIRFIIENPAVVN